RLERAARGRRLRLHAQGPAAGVPHEERGQVVEADHARPAPEGGVRDGPARRDGDGQPRRARRVLRDPQREALRVPQRRRFVAPGGGGLAAGAVREGGGRTESVEGEAGCQEEEKGSTSRGVSVAVAIPGPLRSWTDG